MANGDQRLDAVLLAAVKDLVIEFKALLVRLGLHAGGENAGPVDRGAEGLEAHLGEESNVLLVVVVEVDGLMAGIQPVGADSSRHPFRAGVRAIGAQVRDTGAFAIHVPCALELVGCTGTAPQEIITENAHGLSPLCFLLVYFRRGSAQKTASGHQSCWHRCHSGSAPAPAPAWEAPGSAQTGCSARSEWQAAGPLPH